MVAPDLLHEGELTEGMLPTGSDSLKRKWDEGEDVDQKDDINKWTCAKHVDYHYLDDPFWDKNEEIDLTFTVSLSGEPESLEEAKRSPEWEKAIKVELDQLTKMGTWKLVEKPKDAIPIQ